MGEEPWRVHHAGAPSLDHLRRSKLLTRKELQQRLNLDLNQPTLLVAFHPVTIHRDTTDEADALFDAFAHLPGQILFVYPNSDAGSRALIDRTQAFADDRILTRIFVNLDAITYWSLMGHVDALIGNSSSGIMEAASFVLPVVNIGMRQQGRERAPNIIDTPASTPAILAAIQQARSPDFRATLIGLTNPYGDGHAAVRIVDVLVNTPLEGLLIKAPVPVPAEQEAQ
jgi:UDP-N-acetylglucosamine 2-epimerase (non-hydrolysing)/GDP/UDP-N,N'-diacetylbacillosamine 2-epimerase (hydrolysing)